MYVLPNTYEHLFSIHRARVSSNRVMTARITCFTKPVLSILPGVPLIQPKVMH